MPRLIKKSRKKVGLSPGTLIPLTFIAGIYGMNFEYMPELKIPWAYPALWILLITIFVFMIFWFKRKKWL